METLRLRRIQQQPSNVDRLLALFVTATNRVPHEALQVCTSSALPLELAMLSRRAEEQHRTWCAWTDQLKSWLFTAEMSSPRSRERGMLVLEIHGYSERGELEETGFWAHGKDGTWRRCAD